MIQLRHLFLIVLILATFTASKSYGDSIHGPSVYGSIGGQLGDTRGLMAEISLYDNAYMDGPAGKALRFGVAGNAEKTRYHLGVGLWIYSYFSLGLDLAVRASKDEVEGIQAKFSGGLILLNLYWQPVWLTEKKQVSHEVGIYVHLPVWTRWSSKKTYWFFN